MLQKKRLGNMSKDGYVNGYKLATKQDFDEFITQCEDTAGWNISYDSKDVKVWDMSAEGSAINIVKLWGRIPVSAEVCYDVLHDPEYRKTWDENMHEGYNIEVLDAFNDIGYYSAKSPFFAIAGRDFCNQRCWWVSEDSTSYLIINHSVEHTKCPPNKNFVRAKSIRTGYWLRPDPENSTYCIILYLTQTDPMGMIPTWIVNKATKTFAPKLLDNLIRVGPKYPDWKAANSPDSKPWLAEGQSYWWEAGEKKEEKKSSRLKSDSGKSGSSKRSKNSKSTKSPRKKDGDKSKSEDVKSDNK